MANLRTSHSQKSPRKNFDRNDVRRSAFRKIRTMPMASSPTLSSARISPENHGIAQHHPDGSRAQTPSLQLTSRILPLPLIPINPCTQLATHETPSRTPGVLAAETPPLWPSSHQLVSLKTFERRSSVFQASSRHMASAGRHLEARPSHGARRSATASAS